MFFFEILGLVKPRLKCHTCFSRSSRSGSSADSVDVILGDARDVVIDDELNFRNVKTSTGDVGCDQYFHLKKTKVQFPIKLYTRIVHSTF